MSTKEWIKAKRKRGSFIIGPSFSDTGLSFNITVSNKNEERMGYEVL